MDCFAALAMTLIQFRLPAAHCARAVLVVSLSNQEGAGNAGCWLAPAVSCANSAGGCARAYRYRRGSPAIPARRVYGLYRALPGDEFLFASMAGGLKILQSPVGLATSPPA